VSVKAWHRANKAAQSLGDQKEWVESTFNTHITTVNYMINYGTMVGILCLRFIYDQYLTSLCMCVLAEGVSRDAVRYHELGNGS
jgi:hypothetical protein